jgi:hypothetical protein
MKRLKGGTYQVLGSGGYGCSLLLDETTVGKVNFLAPIWKEWDDTADDTTFLRLQSKIRDLDPNENYFITIRDILYLPFESIQDCYFDWAKRNDRSLKTFPKFFAVYVQSRVKPMTEWTVPDLDHALQGLKLLHSAKIVHNDIHIGNFGMKHSRPVYIDMDSAWYAQDPSIRVLRNGRTTLEKDRTFFYDYELFIRMLEKL